jgi:hypothetical protein
MIEDGNCPILAGLTVIGFGFTFIGIVLVGRIVCLVMWSIGYACLVTVCFAS